jgi:hypothetical protein
MPFALIPTVLGVCFFLVWAFIGGMILRDGQLAANEEREIEDDSRCVAPQSRRKAA